jgi:exosome complex RNA-binding protein Rrp4
VKSRYVKAVALRCAIVGDARLRTLRQGRLVEVRSTRICRVMSRQGRQGGLIRVSLLHGQSRQVKAVQSWPVTSW